MRGFPGLQTGLPVPGDLHIPCHLAQILAGGAGKSGLAGLMIVRICHSAPSGVGPWVLDWAGGGNIAGVGICALGCPLAREILPGGHAGAELGRRKESEPVAGSRLMLLSRGLGTKKGLVRVTEAKGISPQHPETGILKVSRNTLGHIHGSMVVWVN